MRIDRFIVFILLIFLEIVNLHAQQNVLFGEREENFNQSAIFFDRKGNLYPNFYISDSSLQQNGASLEEWYIAHPAQFARVAKSYNCAFTFPDESNLMIINDSIVKFAIRKINGLSNETKNLNVLIHGFRKSFKSSSDRTSTQDFAFWEDVLQTKSKTIVPTLKVYWDASYDCCFSTNSAKNDSLFELFQLTYYRADTIGLSLRSILNSLDYRQINIIGHSLAAKVIQSCVYNMCPTLISGLTQQRVNVCLIAPATSGAETWKNYQVRNTTLPTKDNIRLLILYNEKDFALRKKDNKFGLFGPGTNRYGSTCLGCNKGHEAEKLADYFTQNFPTSTIQILDCTKLGRVHSSRYYISSTYFDEVVKWIE